MVAVAVFDPPDVAFNCSTAHPDPRPVPLTFNHPVLLRELHEQPSGAATWIWNEPPDAGTVNDVDDSVKVHEFVAAGAGALWLTVTG